MPYKLLDEPEEPHTLAASRKAKYMKVREQVGGGKVYPAPVNPAAYFDSEVSHLPLSLCLRIPATCLRFSSTMSARETRLYVVHLLFLVYVVLIRLRAHVFGESCGNFFRFFSSLFTFCSFLSSPNCLSAMYRYTQ